MFIREISNPPLNLKLGGYGFAHSGGYTAAGTFIVRADTQEHLDQILTAIEAGALPAPIVQASAEEVLLATLAAQNAELSVRTAGLEGANALLAGQLLTLQLGG